MADDLAAQMAAMNISDAQVFNSLESTNQIVRSTIISSINRPRALTIQRFQLRFRTYTSLQYCPHGNANLRHYLVVV